MFYTLFLYACTLHHTVIVFLSLSHTKTHLTLSHVASCRSTSHHWRLRVIAQSPASLSLFLSHLVHILGCSHHIRVAHMITVPTSLAVVSFSLSLSLSVHCTYATVRHRQATDSDQGYWLIDWLRLLIAYMKTSQSVGRSYSLDWRLTTSGSSPFRQYTIVQFLIISTNRPSTKSVWLVFLLVNLGHGMIC